MSRLNSDDAETIVGSRYPAPYDQPVAARLRQRLGALGGLTAFGVNRLTLPPGCWSSQRHWHSREDEFVVVLQGQVVLVTDAGETLLGPGDCAAFPAGRADGHHLINRSDQPAVVLEVGNDAFDQDVCVYSDIDLQVGPGDQGYRRMDGTPYP